MATTTDLHELNQRIRAHDATFSGRNLPADTLPGLLDAEQLVILFFLRHLGCTHCRYLVDQLYKLKQANPRFPAVTFVHQEGLDEAAAFFAKRYPGARHLSDPKQALYKLVGINRMKPTDMLNPGLAFKTAGRFLSGHINSLRPTSDPYKLSGMFLFMNGELRWAHRAKTAGDDTAALHHLQKLGKATA